MKRAGWGWLLLWAGQSWGALFPGNNLFPLGGLEELRHSAYIGAGFKAKMVCSGVFVTGRDQRRVEREDLAGEDPNLARIQTDVDYGNRCVTTQVLPIRRIYRTACYEEGFGCRLIDTGPVTPLFGARPTFSAAAPSTDIFILPKAQRANYFPRVNFNRLNYAMSAAFSQPGLNTRSLLVLHQGKVLAEEYAPGFTENTRMHGWSMSKSITNVLLGILQKNGQLNQSPSLVLPEWQGASRERITLDDLLQMSSGLYFDERYAEPSSDVNQMLFAQGDMGAYALNKPLVAPVGRQFHYSSGTSNILQLAMKRSFHYLPEYWQLPYQGLFSRIGMNSAIFETDASGTFVGSSFVYATTRDWARFGQLLLNRGWWGQDQLLPNGWVEASALAAPSAERGEYGKHFWTNWGRDRQGTDRPWPHLPTDAFAAIGYDGQNVLVVPSKDLVIVRFGHTKPEDLWNIDGFASAVIDSLGI